MLRVELPNREHLKDIIPKEYLSNVEEVHREMLSNFSEEISTIPGEFAYDSTIGGAQQISMLKETVLYYLLLRAFTDTSDDEYLEMIGEMNAVFRKKATKSTGKITFYGKNGTVIPKGTIVSTESTSNTNAIQFVTLEDAVIESDSVEVKAECMEAGKKGNIKPGTANILVSDVEYIKRVSNNEFVNGTDKEDLDTLRERIKEAEQEESYSGADVDYERWAKEVDGVGYAYCRETWNGPGTIKLLILDKNRKPASEELLKKVKEYIYPDLKEGQKNRGGKAPTGIKSFTFESPKVKDIRISGSFIITKGYKKETVLEEIKKRMNIYFDKLDIEDSISYNMVNSIIGIFMVDNRGLDDFNDITINGGKSNIKLNSEIATVSEVVSNV